MKIKLLPGAYPPVRAHPSDAGLDLKSMVTDGILPGAAKTFDTGVCLEIPEGYFGQVVSRSGLNIKYGIVVCGGTIDASYRGSIRVKLYNLSDQAYIVDKGDKIAQLVIVPCLTPELEYVDELSETERGVNGFGSSGK